MVEHSLQSVAFPTLDEAQIRQLAQCTAAEPKLFRDRQTLFAVGERDFKFFIIKSGEVDGMIHAVDIYPTLAALAGASTAKCKPLDGMNVWDTIAEGKPSPRTEFIYNVEPFRGAVREGDWKLNWRALIPTSVDLYNLAEDPYEKNNLAAANPEKVAALQRRLEAAGKESTKPLALVWMAGAALKNDHPLMPPEDGHEAAPKGASVSIIDGGFGDDDDHP